MKVAGLLLKAFVVISPWKLKRLLLVKCFGYQISKSARIGYSWVFPDMLVMSDNAHISHFNVVINLRCVELKEHSGISRNNWITGYPIHDKKHFSHIKNRDPRLVLGKHAAITKHHHFDCTDLIEIGDFTIIAGYQSQFLTHSIDLEKSRQDASSIQIGSYCFIGTNVTVLGGSSLPDYSVLGAKSLLNKKFEKDHFLVAGVPAKAIKPISDDPKYFHRPTGFVM